MYQISVWEVSKIRAEALRDIILDIFNRTKETEVKFCSLDSSVSDYDKVVQEYGEHLTFKFKLLDKSF